MPRELTRRQAGTSVVSIQFYADNPVRDYKVQIGGGS